MLVLLELVQQQCLFHFFVNLSVAIIQHGFFCAMFLTNLENRDNIWSVSNMKVFQVYENCHHVIGHVTI